MYLFKALQKVLCAYHAEERLELTDIELNADEWKQVIKWIGLAFNGGKKKMTIADKKLVMKIEVITIGEAEFEKDDDDEIDV